MPYIVHHATDVALQGCIGASSEYEQKITTNTQCRGRRISEEVRLWLAILSVFYRTQHFPAIYHQGIIESIQKEYNR